MSLAYSLENLEAERSLLGCVLLDREAFFTATEILNTEDFFDTTHQKLFEAVIYCSNHNLPIDIVSLRDVLVKQGLREPDSLIQYALQLMETVSTPERAAYYSRLVEEKSRLRKVRRAAQEILNLCSDASVESDQLLAEAERKILAISQGKRAPVAHIDPIAREVLQFYREREGKGGLLGIPSGYSDLDRLTAGFQASDLIIIAGRTSTGKTSFALNIAEHLTTRQKTPTVIFSLEMSKEQLAMRLLCSLARVSSAELRRNEIDVDARNRFEDACQELASAPLYIDDTSALTPMQLKSKARRLKREVNLGLIIVDYLQLLTPDRRYDNRPLEIAEISRTLKETARELQLPVIALSQLSRQADKEERPKLVHLRESGSIEQDADLVIFIHRKDSKGSGDMASETPLIVENVDVELIIAKHRNGPTGSLELVFNQPFTHFRSREQYLNE